MTTTNAKTAPVVWIVSLRVGHTTFFTSTAASRAKTTKSRPGVVIHATAAPRNRLGDEGRLNLPAIFWTLGTVLAFILLNIEIADSFSTGPRIEFQFSGSLARDMTYSIAWALFAAVIMVLGIARHRPALRYAGIALLLVTLVKLFLHDLWSLGGLYRIGALIGLALVLIPVSYLYQRFLAPALVKTERPNVADDEK